MRLAHSAGQSAEEMVAPNRVVCLRAFALVPPASGRITCARRLGPFQGVVGRLSTEKTHRFRKQSGRNRRRPYFGREPGRNSQSFYALSSDEGFNWARRV
ncbi:unnamed protein product [Protopolystoma xenopodis]|uniref:Uncharacterized protein n=1 Tax=Protopolystoma xenopodis TaxID=117903 RepID=A0A448WGW1_9PLAT|nr:unnamed protein product [Protopolystoma xenopodis]